MSHLMIHHRIIILECKNKFGITKYIFFNIFIIFAINLIKYKYYAN